MASEAYNYHKHDNKKAEELSNQIIKHIGGKPKKKLVIQNTTKRVLMLSTVFSVETNFAQIVVVHVVLVVRLQGAQRRLRQDHPAPAAVVVVLVPELLHYQVGGARAGRGVQHVRRRGVRQLCKIVVKNHLLRKT